MAEGARRRGQLGGAAVGADRGRLELAAALDREGAGEDRPRRRGARPARTRRSGSTRRAPAPRCATRVPSATTWSPAVTRTRSPTTTSPTGTSRGVPSRTTVASGATSAARLSRARLARTSWKVPIPMLATRMPRKRASLGLPKSDRRGAEDGEDQVEHGEGVADEDRAVGAARRFLRQPPALAQPPLRLLLGEAGDGGVSDLGAQARERSRAGGRAAALMTFVTHRATKVMRSRDGARVEQGLDTPATRRRAPTNMLGP